MGLGRNIRRLRNAAGFTQSDLAQKVGVTRVAISTWERDENAPNSDNGFALAKALGVSVDELYGDERPPLPPGAFRAASEKWVDVPLYGSISAGVPREMIPVEEFTGAPESIVAQCRDPYYLQVSGDSMNRILPNGCYALVDACSEVDHDGQPYVVSVNGDDATVKRVRRLANGIVLEPDSYDITYRPQTFDFGDPACPEVRVLGRVVWYTMPRKLSF